MKVKLAKTAGFCMGVRRAMEIVLAEANRGEGPLFTYGPLIHNKQVLELLESKGVCPINDVKDIKTGRIVIRAHGVPPLERDEIEKTGLKIFDATCPRVIRVQAIIRNYTQKGYCAVIVGDKDHAEVVGLMGFSEGPAYVVESLEDIPALPELERIFVVAQTTQNEKYYSEVVKLLNEKYNEVVVFDTICGATHQRQQEVRSFSGQVDAVVVVGGYHSGNTRRLVQVSNENDMATFHIETEEDVDTVKLSGMEAIGVTAGASTPNWMIKNVVSKIEGIRGRKETLIGRWLREGFKFLALSNLLVSFGAFSFACAASTLSGRIGDLTYPLITLLYIYAMYVLNLFLDKAASAYNDPEKGFFLRKYRLLLIITGACSIAVAAVISFRIGMVTFLALTFLSFLGVVYSVPIIPGKIRHLCRYSKIKDIPGSRSLSEALAWVAVITILPLLEIELNKIDYYAVTIASLTVFLMSYVRCVLFDIFHVQGDLVVGMETLPIMLGEKRTLMLLKTALCAAGIILVLSPVFGFSGTFSYILIISLISLSLCLAAYEKRLIHPGIDFEALVEGNFFLAGLLALIWQAA